MVKKHTERDRRQLYKKDDNNISVNVCKIKVNIRNKKASLLHNLLMNAGTEMVHAWSHSHRPSYSGII